MTDKRNEALRREHLRRLARERQQAGLCPTCGRRGCDTTERMRNL